MYQIKGPKTSFLPTLLTDMFRSRPPLMRFHGESKHVGKQSCQSKLCPCDGSVWKQSAGKLGYYMTTDTHLHDSIPGKRTELFPSPQHPDRQLGPPNILLQEQSILRRGQSGRYVKLHHHSQPWCQQIKIANVGDDTWIILHFPSIRIRLEDSQSICFLRGPIHNASQPLPWTDRVWAINLSLKYGQLMANLITSTPLKCR